MAFQFLVHLVNPVSGWVVTQVHAIAEDEKEAVTKALAQYGVSESELGQTLRAIPQVIGTALEAVAVQEKETALEAVAAEPAPVSVAGAESEAEAVAAKVLASLPADVLAAVESALKGK